MGEKHKRDRDKEIRKRKSWKNGIWLKLFLGIFLCICLMLKFKTVHNGDIDVDTALKLLRQDENLNLREKFKEQTVTYSDYCKVYRPGYESLEYDSREHLLYYNNILVVSLMEDLSDQEKQTLAVQVDGQIVGSISGAMNMLQIRVAAQDISKLEACAKKVMEDDRVLYASIDSPVGITADFAEDNNPWRGTGEAAESDKGNIENPDGNDWWAEAVDAYTAWKYDKYAQPIKVAVIDNGFSENHEDLDIKILNENQLEDHGTNVVGVIGAQNNKVGIRGVADQAELLGISYSNFQSSYEFLGLLSEEIRQGAKVVNMSFGTYAYSRKGYRKNIGKVSLAGYKLYLEDLKRNSKTNAKVCMTAMMNLHLQGYDDYLLVQSAGNGVDNGKGPGLDTIVQGWFGSLTYSVYEDMRTHYSEKVQEKLKEAGGYPYFSSRILIVGAVKNERDRQGYYKMSYSSNYGSQVDICAPGEKIYSTVAFKKNTQIASSSEYDFRDGTSMSAPIVSGAAALVWSVNPELTAPEVKQILIETAKTKAIDEDAVEEPKTYPMLNVGSAVTKAYELYKSQALEINGKPDADVYSSDAETTVIKDDKMSAETALQEYLCAVLVPQYGVMDTALIKGTGDTYENGSHWTATDINGLLSATMLDFDNDGQMELLTVGYESKPYNENGIQTDIVLCMYEYEPEVGVTQSAIRRMATNGGFCESSIGYRQICVFAYEYQGGVYLAVDNWLYANESIVTLAVFQYGGNGIVFAHVPHTSLVEKADYQITHAGNAFDFVVSMSYQAQGQGDLYAKWAYIEPQDPLFCGWNYKDWITICGYTVESDPSPSEEQKKEYMDEYRYCVEDVGLCTEDDRIGMQENSGWPLESCDSHLVAAPDVYKAQEGKISFLSGIYMYWGNEEDGFASIADKSKNLIRKDYGGTLDAFR